MVAVAVLTLLACATAITLLAISRAHWMDETERFEAAADHNLEAAGRWEDTADEFERKLGASESDVKSLRVSQRRVAAQKAKVEDQRAALEDQRAQLTVVASSLASIADGFSSCASTLDSVIDYVLSEDYDTAGTLYGTASSQCSTARSQLDALDLAVG